jgi:hypothetical protein
VRSLHDVHEINALELTISVCLSVRMMQLHNRLMEFDEIWYGRYTIGVQPKIVLFNLLQPEETNMANERISEVGSNQRHLQQGHTVIQDNRFLKNTQYCSLRNVKQLHGIKKIYFTGIRSHGHRNNSHCAILLIYISKEGITNTRFVLYETVVF